MSYIEQRFELLVRRKENGQNLVTKWRSDKSVYTGYTSTTAFDFEHFSKHDESHSIRILQNIELLLGRSRVERLGAGDLWLLLQTAYFHDIGMSLTNEDMEKLWEKDSEFREFLKERLTEGRYGDNTELYDAIEYYSKVDQVINQKADFEAICKSNLDEPKPDWPIQLTHSVQYIVAEYVRKQHGKRSKDYFERIFKDDKNFSEGVIEKRLYNLVGEISAIHTKDFSAVLELFEEEVALGDEHIHPRFAAAMLRIGDLLDMDNNRFNLRVLEHRGPLPPKSAAHLRKHKALNHFEITPVAIYAQAYSKDFDTCLETRLWYNWIEAEVGDLIQHWNQIAPKALTGCLLKHCKLEVYLDGTLFTSRNLNHFNFDNRKMQKLLIGDSIYDCRLDCLREYVQNAIDATKVCLWKKLKENGYDRPIKSNIPLKELLPCDLKEDALLSLPIEITFSYEPGNTGLASDHICIEIQDRGIGMDKACIESITTIGKGWRARDEYQDVFSCAPKWLQPTGGFGIGIQSAFMITDTVCYTTRSEKEGNGYLVRLMSPEYSGNVTREEYSYPRSHGTTVVFRVQAIKFMTYEELGLDEKFINQFEESHARVERDLLNMFNQENILHRAIEICKEYLSEQIPNAIFPIYIGEKGAKPERMTSPYLYNQKNGKNETGQPLEMLEFTEKITKSKDTGERIRWCYYIESRRGPNRYGERFSQVIIWNTKYMDCVCIGFSDRPLKVTSGQVLRRNFQTKLRVAFKGISVSKEDQDFCCGEVFLDIMGERAENCLQVSRSRLKGDFHDQLYKRLNEYFLFGMDQLAGAYTEHMLELQAEIRQKQEEEKSECSADQRDIVATPDYMRMVFFCFAYLPLNQDAPWLRALEMVRKFSQQALDDIKTFKMGQEPGVESGAGQNKQGNLPCNVVRYLAQKLSEAALGKTLVFFCSDEPQLSQKRGIQLRQDSVGTAELCEALDIMAKKSAWAALTSGEQEEKAGTVYSYLLQNEEVAFPNIWGIAVFGSYEGIWVHCRKVVAGGRQIEVGQDKKETVLLPQLTAYILDIETPMAGSAEESRLDQAIFSHDDELCRKYSLWVSRIPFQRLPLHGDGFVISPLYERLKVELKLLRDKHPLDEKVAVRILLQKNANFRGLIDWVHRFQIPVEGQKYRTKVEIEEIYLQWVLDYYYDL